MTDCVELEVEKIDTAWTWAAEGLDTGRVSLTADAAIDGAVQTGNVDPAADIKEIAVAKWTRTNYSLMHC